MDLNLVFWHPVAKVVFAGLGNGDLFMLKVGTEELKCYSGAGFEVSAAKITENGLGNFIIDIFVILIPYFVSETSIK